MLTPLYLTLITHVYNYILHQFLQTINFYIFLKIDIFIYLQEDKLCVIVGEKKGAKS